MHTQRISILLGILLPCICGVEYGPSLSSLTGVFVNWKGPDLFAIESGRKVKLENYPGYAAVIPLVTGDSKATSDQIFKERGISTVGEFIVEAPKGYGIIAVIQEMKLRKTTRDRGSSNANPNATLTCSDYIQFGENKAEGTGGVSPKICGTISRDDTSMKPSGVLGPRTYRSTSGRVRTAFNHAYVAELVDSLLGSKQKHVLRLEIVYTAYKTNCTSEYSASSSITTPESVKVEDGYEICSDYETLVNPPCISSKLLCDDIYNCGGDSETLGSDDGFSTCPDKPIRTTVEPLPEEKEPENDEKPDGLSNLATYLGIPSLSSFPQRKFERRFRPSYVSSSQQFGSGYSFDFTTRRSDKVASTSSTTEDPSYNNNNNSSNNASSVSISDAEVSSNSDSSNNLLRYETDSDIYSRRELSHAINSVIYGVAIFIIFTIFITVFVVCIAKKIQMTWSARRSSCSTESERSNATSVSIPNPAIPSATATVITSALGPGCIPPVSNGELAYAPANTTVVLLTLPQNVEAYDPPPSYDTLFPSQNNCS